MARTGGHEASEDEAPSLAGAAWRERAIERSTQSARQRAAKRVQRFLVSAREIIAEKGTTDFTVQEVVDRSKQSLRSFYQYFGGKHELLLGLFEEEIDAAVERLKAVSSEGEPLERLRAATIALYESSLPGHDAVQPLFFEFARRLMVDHPVEVSAAYSPVFEYLASIVEEVGQAGLLRPGRPRRMATLVLQVATTTGERVAAATPGRAPSITADEVWDFCLHAIVADSAIEARRASRSAKGKKSS